MMAFGDRTAAARGGRARLLAALACALALGLLAWRGAALLTGPGAPVSATPAEAALSDILSPVAGPGLSRVSVAYNGDGGRTVLVLLDETATPRLPELNRIVPIAAGIIPERGDRLVIETVAFAGGLPGRPDLAAWIELAALAGLVLISGALAFLASATAPVATVPAQILPAATPAPQPVDRPRAVRPAATTAPADAAADIARRDPARAAAVVRGWMNSRDETA
jgi:flagellar biosynthesis/type III secretory pathway M-ring protein FliF/YscJ